MNHSVLTATGDGDVAVVGAASVTFTIVLKANERYRLSSNAALWWVQATTPTAVAHTAPAAYLAAGSEVIVTTAAGLPTKIAVIQDSVTGGFASLNRVSVGR
jgi:hypothetical protein